MVVVYLSLLGFSLWWQIDLQKTAIGEREREREETMLLGFCFRPKREREQTDLMLLGFCFCFIEMNVSIGLTNNDYSLVLLSSIGLMSSIAVLLLLQHEVCEVAQT